MAQLGFDFNDEEYQDYGSKTVLPEGNYKVIIVNSEIKENNNKNGMNLFITYNVQDPTGKYQGVELKECLCVKHVTKDTQDIARSKLATIKRRTKVMGKMGDSAMLHGRSIMVRVVTNDKQWTNENGKLIEFKENKITGYPVVNNSLDKQPTQTQETSTSSW